MKKDVSSTILPRRPGAGGGRGRVAAPRARKAETRSPGGGRRRSLRVGGADGAPRAGRPRGLSGSDPRRPVNPRFKSLKAGLGCPEPSSGERFCAVCFLPTPRPSPGDSAPLRLGAASLRIDGSRSSLSQRLQAAGSTWSTGWTR